MRKRYSILARKVEQQGLYLTVHAERLVRLRALWTRLDILKPIESGGHKIPRENWTLWVKL